MPAALTASHFALRMHRA